MLRALGLIDEPVRFGAAVRLSWRAADCLAVADDPGA
jgi:hypothetical protein